MKLSLTPNRVCRFYDIETITFEQLLANKDACYQLSPAMRRSLFWPNDRDALGYFVDCALEQDETNSYMVFPAGGTTPACAEVLNEKSLTKLIVTTEQLGSGDNAINWFFVTIESSDEDKRAPFQLGMPDLLAACEDRDNAIMYSITDVPDYVKDSRAALAYFLHYAFDISTTDKRKLYYYPLTERYELNLYNNLADYYISIEAFDAKSSSGNRWNYYVERYEVPFTVEV